MPRHTSFRLLRTRPPLTAPFTLVFDLRPDIMSGNAGDVSNQTVTCNGTSLGVFTSGAAFAAGPASWATRSVVITPYVTVGTTIHITTQYTSGADTGYFRNMYVQDTNGTRFYGGYPSGSLYTSDVAINGGAPQDYIIVQGGGTPQIYSVTTATFVAPSEADNKGHYYIPGSVFS